MAATQYFEQVQKIFIAFYQRPADPAGLKYWAQRVDAAGGDIGQVINAFASSPEAVALYGAIDATTIGTVIDSLYMALFNTAPDAAGKAFYVDGFAAGTFTAGTIALAVLNGAQNDDLIAVNNKVQVANEFTQQVDGRPLTDAYFGTGTGFNVTYAGDADAQAARDILKGVTFDSASVINPSQVTEELKAKIADATDPIIGQTGGKTFMLTTSEDSGAAFTGGAGNDLFESNVVNVNGTLTQTFQSVDSLNGGAGIDTLNVTTTAVNVAATLVGIENIVLRSAGTTASGIDLASATGVEKLTVAKSSATAVINNVGALANFAVADQKTGVGINGGTATTVALETTNVGTVSKTAPVKVLVNLADNAFTTANLTTTNSNVQLQNSTAGNNTLQSVTIAATGANNVDLLAGATTATSIAVTGAGSVDLSAQSFSALKTLTVADGGVKAISTNATANALTVTTGAGVDTVTAIGVSIKSVATGAGNDAVTTTGDAAATAVVTAAQAALTASQALATAANATAATAATTLATANATLATDTAAAATAVTAAATAAINATNAAATVATDTTAAANATTVATSTAATLAASETAATAAATALTASTAAAVIADDLVTTTAAAAATAATTLADSTAADVVAADLVTSTAATAAAAVAPLAAANAVVTALATMHTAIQAIAGPSGEQAANNAATAAAVTAGAITNSQKSAIDTAFGIGFLTDLGTAKSSAATAYADIVTDAGTAAAAALAAKNTADTEKTNAIAAQVITAAQVVTDTTAKTAADTAAATAATAKATADAQVVADAAAKTAADSQVAADTTIDTAAQATKTAADAALAASTTAKTAADAAKTTADAAVITANGLVAADTAAVATATADKTAADTAANSANAVVATDTAAVTAAQNAAMATGGLSATATVDLGAGDDTLTLSNGFMAGATINGGDGVDTLKMTGGNYLTAAAYAADKLALVSNFEALSFSDALTSNTYDVAKIAGITSVTVGNGVATGNTAVLSNLAANSTVTLAGALGANLGALQLALKTDTGADVVNLVLKPTYTDNNDTTVDARNFYETVVAQFVETINVNSTGMKNSFTPVDGYKADLVNNTLNLIDNALVTLNVTGDAALSFTSSAAQTKLATVNAATNTGGLNFDGSAADKVNGVAMTITGSATAANSLIATNLGDTLTGGAGNDLIVGGDGKDTINAGAGRDFVVSSGGSDTITLGAGNDVYFLSDAAHSVLAAADTLIGFNANTKAFSASAADITKGAFVSVVADGSDLTGDTIDVSWALFGTGVNGIKVFVANNAADAQTFIQNTANVNTGTAADYTGFALDSTTNLLYLDFNQDGVIDSVIKLAGVTTITEAAFVTGL